MEELCCMTALHRAAWRGYKDEVKLLVSKGAAVDAVDESRCW